MFNKKLVDTLSLVNNVTNSVILKYPNTVAVSDAGDVIMFLDVSKIDEDSFENIPLKDSLSDFINFLKLIDDPAIEIDNNKIVSKNDNKSASFIMNEISLMDFYDKSDEIFTNIENFPSCAKFVLSSQDIKDLKNASNVFKDLDEVVIESQDGDTSVYLASTGRYNAKSNTFAITKTDCSSKEFTIKIPVENFKTIPSGGFNLHVKHNQDKDIYRILLVNENFEGLKILMAVNAD